MNRFNNKNFIQADLNSIRNELIKNSRMFIQNLVKSLKTKKNQPFTSYKIDLSLIYLKNTYEKAFPHKKHGGVRFPKTKNSKNIAKNSLLDQVTKTVTWDKSISLLEKSIVLNLLEGIAIRKDVPSFVKLICVRSELRRTAIQNRIRVGKFAINSNKIDDLILLYRKKGVSHSKVLKEIRKLDKRTKF
jgi:hypothetical protein